MTTINWPTSVTLDIPTVSLIVSTVTGIVSTIGTAGARWHLPPALAIRRAVVHSRTLARSHAAGPIAACNTRGGTYTTGKS
jgi:hypothetical protein